MPRNFSNQLAGQIGESLVVAELGRRGIVATSFAGNVPDIDILAYRDGRTVALQVKSVRTGSISFDAGRFLTIIFDDKKQIIEGHNPMLDAALIYVVVEIGLDRVKDKFYVFRQSDLQGIVYVNHAAYLAKHNGIRPRNPQSTHVSVTLGQLGCFLNKWDLIHSHLQPVSLCLDLKTTRPSV